MYVCVGVTEGGGGGALGHCYSFLESCETSGSRKSLKSVAPPGDSCLLSSLTACRLSLPLLSNAIICSSLCKDHVNWIMSYSSGYTVDIRSGDESR